jgi:group I intron endonuclease
MQGIYKITNKCNNHIYIGKSNNIERRFNDHKRLALTEGHKEFNKSLYCAIRKYGIENFIFEIIEELEDYTKSGEREQYWINYYDSYNNGYNESLGGDGGSSPGHCSGEKNGRAKLSKEDVILIRQKYKDGISKKECYEIFKDKISEGGFARVWQGQTWKDIMPEVYTKENKKRNEYLGKSLAARTQRILTEQQVRDIRAFRDKGVKPLMIYNIYKDICSYSCICDIYYNRTYKEVI